MPLHQYTVCCSGLKTTGRLRKKKTKQHTTHNRMTTMSLSMVPSCCRSRQPVRLHLVVGAASAGSWYCADSDVSAFYGWWPAVRRRRIPMPVLLCGWPGEDGIVRKWREGEYGGSSGRRPGGELTKISSPSRDNDMANVIMISHKVVSQKAPVTCS